MRCRRRLGEGELGMDAECADCENDDGNVGETLQEQFARFRRRKQVRGSMRDPR